MLYSVDIAKRTYILGRVESWFETTVREQVECVSQIAAGLRAMSRKQEKD